MTSLLRSPLGLFLLAVAICVPAWARDDQRITQVREAVQSLEGVMADNDSPKADRPRLQRKLDALKQELGVLEEREAIDVRARQLKTEVQNLTREQLRAKLQTVSAVPAAVEARQQQLDERRAKATAERTALVAQREDTSQPMTDAHRAELDEQIYTKNEEIRAIALQQEAAEYERLLILLAKKLREQMLTEEDAASHFSLRVWFDKRSDQQAYLVRQKQLDSELASVADNLHVAEASLDLNKQKLANIGVDLQVLDRQTSFLRRNPQLDLLLATEKAQQQFIGLRQPFLNEQVDALHLKREFIRSQQDLVTMEAQLLAEQLIIMRAAYVNHLLPPATAIAVFLLTYLLSSRIVLPRFFRKEDLFMARRLGRYGTVLLIALIIAVYMMEDLRVIAATLGLVSAAIVISLQDVCVSFFGWSVIMVSRKFVIGDRLEIDGVRGDVLDIQLLRTTFLEINNWLGVDQPTGRVVIIPNSFVFRSKVFNSSHCHPYVWGKVEITITNSTPVADATLLFERVLEEETREVFAEAQAASSAMKERYEVEDAEYRPKIYTRIADSGITFSLLYVSHFRDTASTRNRINLRLIAEIEQNKEIQLAYNTLTIQMTSAQPDKPSAVLHSHAPFPTRPAG
jgi:small-conductance mechanosensitive channel